MKPLLLFLGLLACQWISGQDIDNDTSIFRGKFSVIYPKYITFQDIVKECQIYKKECYADSTLTHTYQSIMGERCYRWAGSLATGEYLVLDCQDSSHYTYTHKSPDNLSEFMEYLTNKYNE